MTERRPGPHFAPTPGRRRAAAPAQRCPVQTPGGRPHEALLPCEALACAALSVCQCDPAQAPGPRPCEAALCAAVSAWCGWSLVVV